VRDYPDTAVSQRGSATRRWPDTPTASRLGDERADGGHVWSIRVGPDLADTGCMNPRRARLGLLLLATGIFIAAALTPPSDVTAVRVAATAQTALTAQERSDGASLPVSFSWHGATVTEDQQSPACRGGVAKGASVAVYVASNDPSNMGPDANWILNPDTHDPSTSSARTACAVSSPPWVPCRLSLP
jgi:hypothetical protein